MKRVLLTLTATLALSSPAAAQSGIAPVPSIVGEKQLVAPGTRPEPKLPTLTLTPAISEVSKIETISNGFITGAHALVLVPDNEVAEARLRQLALEVVERTYAARPNLGEVDVSLYRAGTYAGFGGPLPLMTLSVPAERHTQFRAQWEAGSYERMWLNPQPNARPEPQVVEDLEQTPVFFGTAADLIKEKVEQALGILHGGARSNEIFRGNTSGREVALTYDDAPHPMYFPLVLDALRRSKAHATFFLIGRNVEAYPYFVKDMVEQGHELGNHTYHHIRLPKLSDEEILSEMKSTNDLLTRITGQSVKYFRPPGGEYSPRVVQLAQSLGMKMVFWTDDPGDFQNPGVSTVEQRYARHLRPGGIILLHDNAPDGLMALPDLLRVAQERGYVLNTVGSFDR